MNLTKKQVKAFLEVLSSDDTRPILTQASIELHNDHTYLVATDAYKLAAILVNGVSDMIGKRIPREELVKWYKLASNKDYFTDENVRELATLDPEEHGKYPEWQKLMPKDDQEKSQQTSIGVNASYLLTMENLAQERTGSGMYWDCYNNTMLVNRSNDNYYIVMELRKR